MYRRPEKHYCIGPCQRVCIDISVYSNKQQREYRNTRQCLMCSQGAQYLFGLSMDQQTCNASVCRVNDLPDIPSPRRRLKQSRFDKKYPELYRAVSAHKKRKHSSIGQFNMKKKNAILLHEEPVESVDISDEYGFGDVDEEVVVPNDKDTEEVPEGYEELVASINVQDDILDDDKRDSDDNSDERIDSESDEDEPEPDAEPMTSQNINTKNACCFCGKLCDGLAHAACTHGPTAW